MVEEYRQEFLKETFSEEKDNNQSNGPIKKEEAKAKDSNYKRRLPLFIGEKDNATFYIVPVRGKGLWDAIWGYVSLDKDLVVEGDFIKSQTNNS
mgnify:CR=1 FL=1